MPRPKNLRSYATTLYDLAVQLSTGEPFHFTLPSYKRAQSWKAEWFSFHAALKRSVENNRVSGDTALANEHEQLLLGCKGHKLSLIPENADKSGKCTIRFTPRDEDPDMQGLAAALRAADTNTNSLKEKVEKPIPLTNMDFESLIRARQTISILPSAEQDRAEGKSIGDIPDGPLPYPEGK